MVILCLKLTTSSIIFTNLLLVSLMLIIIYIVAIRMSLEEAQSGQSSASTMYPTFSPQTEPTKNQVIQCTLIYLYYNNVVLFSPLVVR